MKEEVLGPGPMTQPNDLSNDPVWNAQLSGGCVRRADKIGREAHGKPFCQK